jgi:uncharacterized protein (DUF433 family)
MKFTDNHIQDISIYPAIDAARYLRIPLGTLHAWRRGRTYQTKDGQQFSKPLIQSSNLNFSQLSFTNLIEAHVLRVIRQDHKIRLDKVRTALDYIEREFDVPHPLARLEFQTDGVNLFVSSVGKLINASEYGQLAMRETLTQLLKRIEYDRKIAVRLFPNLRPNQTDSPKILVFDPHVSFGRLTIAGTGIPTSVVVERYRAGDSIDLLADDYDCSRNQIEEAIRFELPPRPEVA